MLSDIDISQALKDVTIADIQFISYEQPALKSLGDTLNKKIELLTNKCAITLQATSIETAIQNLPTTKGQGCHIALHEGFINRYLFNCSDANTAVLLGQVSVFLKENLKTHPFLLDSPSDESRTDMINNEFFS